MHETLVYQNPHPSGCTPPCSARRFPFEVLPSDLSTAEALLAREIAEPREFTIDGYVDLVNRIERCVQATFPLEFRSMLESYGAGHISVGITEFLSTFNIDEVYGDALSRASRQTEIRQRMDHAVIGVLQAYVSIYMMSRELEWLTRDTYLDFVERAQWGDSTTTVEGCLSFICAYDSRDDTFTNIADSKLAHECPLPLMNKPQDYYDPARHVPVALFVRNTLESVWREYLLVDELPDGGGLNRHSPEQLAAAYAKGIISESPARFIGCGIKEASDVRKAA